MKVKNIGKIFPDFKASVLPEAFLWLKLCKDIGNYLFSEYNNDIKYIFLTGILI